MKMKDTMLELSKLRESQGLTRKEIASKIGCSERSLISWEQDKFIPSPIYQTKIKELIKQLRDKEFQENSGDKISKILLDVLSEGWFDKEISEAGQRSFLAWRIARLSELKTFVKDDVYSENLIVKALEGLCRKGFLKCMAIQAFDRDNFRFYFEIGKGDYSWSTGQPKITRLYREKPLSPEELKSREVTLALIDLCERQEAERRQYFKSQYGKPGTVEQSLVHENYQDAIEARDRENRLVKGIEKLGEKK